MRSYLILGMCTLFLVQYFVDVQWLQFVVVLLALLAFIGSATKANLFPRIIGLLMMGIGIVLEWSKGTGVEGISDGIFIILPLLSLITLTPLISIPLKLGGFFESVSRLLHNLLNRPKKLYSGVTGTLFILSPILSLGAVRIIHDFLEDLKLPKSMSAKSYVVGYSTAVMWSPYFASVSLVLQYLSIPYKDYVIYGIGLSLLWMAVGGIMFAIWERKNPMITGMAAVEPLDGADRNQLIKLVLIVVGLLGSCLLIENLTGWSMIVVVCLVSLIVPFVYGLISSDWKRLKVLLVDFRDRSVPMMNNEIMLFMSAGMLAFAMKGTTLMNGVSAFLAQAAQASFFLFALAIMAIVLGITYFGIHQIAAVGVLAMQLNAAELGMSNMALAMVLLLTWACSTAISPFSGLNLMVSRFSGISKKEALQALGPHLFIVSLIGFSIISLFG